jgi:signal transduction histidine kinase
MALFPSPDPQAAPADAGAAHTALFVLLGRLAAAVSHEIRNPLQSLALHLELLEEEPHPSGDLADILAIMTRDLARVQSVVEDYLSLARIPNVRQAPLAVGALLEAFCREELAVVQARGVQLHLEGAATVGHVPLHAPTFRRIVLNLVQNALDAMPDGGHLTLRCQRTAAHFMLAVQDTGVGIPAAHLPQLFAPLYTTKVGGTGLGLYVVQEIIKAHGGTVDVTSTPGAGTTFTVRLPLVVPEERA